MRVWIGRINNLYRIGKVKKNILVFPTDRGVSAENMPISICPELFEKITGISLEIGEIEEIEEITIRLKENK